ncbi:MAG: cell division topological specificity factor MinE [Clostridia bacterium]|nr:cell division topological specificity factor MinE [Clostridia bacterium]
MYNQYNSESFDRLSRILKNDKIHMPQMIENSLKKDILRAISGYMNIKDCNSELKIEVANSGEILITFEGVAESFNPAKLNGC